MSSFPILPKIRLSPHPLPPSLSLRPLFIPIYFFGRKICTFSLLHRDSPRTPLSMFNDAKTQKHKNNKKNKTNQNQYSWTSLNIGPKPGGNQRYRKKPEDLSMCREARVLGWNNTHIKRVHQQKPITPPLGHCSAQQTLPLIW